MINYVLKSLVETEQKSILNSYNIDEDLLKIEPENTLMIIEEKD